jgi:nicotinate phosphoribosyltransferase
MAIAALANGDEELAQAPYKVLDLWKEMYHGNLLVLLPDAFGSTSFLKNAPDSVADWVGYRPDSKDPMIGTQEYIDWIISKNRLPREKLVILSDGMEIDSIEAAFRHFNTLPDPDHRPRLSFGWGTNLTNDFKGCTPVGNENMFKSMSLVCKVVEADGRPAVKLSDNPSKAMGPKEEVERYLRVFGQEGMVRKDVTV